MRLENGANDEVILAAVKNSKIEEARYEELTLLEATAVKVQSSMAPKVGLALSNEADIHESYKQLYGELNVARQIVAVELEPLCIAQKNYVELAYEAAVAKRKVESDVVFSPLPQIKTINVPRCIEERLEGELPSGPQGFTPAQVKGLKMQVDSCGINLQWAEPDQIQFFSVVGYEIEVKSKDGTYMPYNSCFQASAIQTNCHMKLNFLV